MTSCNVRSLFLTECLLTDQFRQIREDLMFDRYRSEKLVNICSCRLDQAERAKADLSV